MASESRSKAFFLRMTPADIDMLNGIAEDEQRPYTQVAALVMHAALMGFGKCSGTVSLLEYCRRLEIGVMARLPSGQPPTGIRRAGGE